MSDDLCPICLNDLDNGRTIKTLSCGHKFHAICVNDWIENMESNNLPKKCPMCRGDINESNLIRTETLDNALYTLANIFFHDEVIQLARRYRRLAMLVGLFATYNISSVISSRIHYNIIYYITQLICSINGRVYDENDREFWITFSCVLGVFIINIIGNYVADNVVLHGTPNRIRSLKKTTLTLNKTTLTLNKTKPPSTRALNQFIDKVMKPTFKDISSKKIAIKPGFIDKKLFLEHIELKNRAFFTNFIMRAHFLYIGITKDEKTFKKFIRSILKKLNKVLKKAQKTKITSSLRREVDKHLSKLK